MPTITVDTQDLLQLIGKSYTVEELDALLRLVKGEVKEYAADTGELKIELKDTNRPDLWCPEGIARQLRCRTEALDYSDLLRCSEVLVEKKIRIDANIREIRPYIGAFIAKGVAVTEQTLIQLIQTQEKLCDSYGKKRELLAIGIYNADKIRFPVHYQAIDPHSIRFVPLGYEQPMNLAEILAQHPKGIEFGAILHGQERYPILLDDQGDVLSFPPVINSRLSGEILVGDQHLFVEITGLDLAMTLHAVNILAYNFNDRGFEIEPVCSVYPYETAYGREVISPYPLNTAVEVEYRLFERYLGKAYPVAEILARLNAYGVSARQHRPDALLVSTYPYRQDYMHGVDVVEDFAIASGYDMFAPIMPEQFTVGHLAPMTIVEDNVRDALIGFGFEEVILNVLSNREEFGAEIRAIYGDVLTIRNPMTESYSIVRNSLIPSLLKVEAKSSKSLYPHKVFEVGEVVLRDEAENHGCVTKSTLTALLSHAEANFSEMGSYLAHLGYLMFWETTLRAAAVPMFIAGRAGEIVSGDTVVGIIGEIHPEILDTWGINMPTVLFELDLSALFYLS